MHVVAVVAACSSAKLGYLIYTGVH